MRMMQQDFETRAQRRMRRRCHPISGSSRLYLSVLLIIAGLLLFLGNLGLFPLHSVWELWPLVLVALGLGRLNDCTDPAGRIWASAMIIFGGVFFCISMGFLHLRAHDGSWPLAVGLIAFGVLALTKTFEHPQPPRPHPQPFGPEETPFNPNPMPPDADILNDSAILGSVQRRVESTNFRGGVLNCVLGSIELDLRRAYPPNPQEPITIETTCVMGNIKLRIPETWRLSIVGVPVLGSYQDSTVPIARPDFITGTLILSGSCVLSSVEIEN
jgi:Domain of unknown function (DUF5668)